MTTLHLIRHGETNWNAERRCQGQSESELSLVGKAQAEQCLSLIDQLNITRLYVSSSLRTQQTADILNRNLSLDIHLRDDLKEINLGSWETQLWADIHQQDPHDAEMFHTRPEAFAKKGAETYAQLRERGVSALESIIKSEPGQQILAVSHGALIKTALSHYAGVELAQLRAIPGLDNCSHSVVVAIPDNTRQVKVIGGQAFSETAWA